jgi:hypothetical protein
MYRMCCSDTAYIGMVRVVLSKPLNVVLTWSVLNSHTSMSPVIPGRGLNLASKQGNN